MATKAKTKVPAPAQEEDLPLPRKRTTKPINLQVRVDERLLGRIATQAEKMGLPASTMARILIMERLNELEGKS